MHNLLARQIKKFFGGEEKVPGQATAFVAAVNDAYQQSDIDRAMLERSLDLSSQELLQAVSLLSATLEAAADGVLVIDLKGRVERYNQRFLKMWQIPASLAETRDDAKLLEYVMGQLSDPDKFIAKVKELYSKPEAESYDLIEFKDGRTFERLSLPQKLGNEIVGRVWSFRDITDRLKGETELKEKVAEMKEFYDLAVGRELKMIELEDEIERLKSQGGKA